MCLHPGLAKPEPSEVTRDACSGSCCCFVNPNPNTIPNVRVQVPDGLGIWPKVPPPLPSHERAEEVTLPDESARHPVLALKATISSPFIARETQRVHHVNRQVIDSLLCFWWYWQQFCVKVNTGVCMRC